MGKSKKKTARSLKKEKIGLGALGIGALGLGAYYLYNKNGKQTDEKRGDLKKQIEANEERLNKEREKRQKDLEESAKKGQELNKQAELVKEKIKRQEELRKQELKKQESEEADKKMREKRAEADKVERERHAELLKQRKEEEEIEKIKKAQGEERERLRKIEEAEKNRKDRVEAQAKLDNETPEEKRKIIYHVLAEKNEYREKHNMGFSNRIKREIDTIINGKYTGYENISKDHVYYGINYITGPYPEEFDTALAEACNCLDIPYNYNYDDRSLTVDLSDNNVLKITDYIKDIIVDTDSNYSDYDSALLLATRVCGLSKSQELLMLANCLWDKKIEILNAENEGIERTTPPYAFAYKYAKTPAQIEAEFLHHKINIANIEKKKW